MFFSSIKEIYRLISTRTSNIYLKVTAEKKRSRYPKLQFFKFKKVFSYRSVFGELQLTQILQNFQTSCCNLKIRDLGTSLCLAFQSTILILKGLMTKGPSTNNFRHTYQILIKKPPPPVLNKAYQPVCTGKIAVSCHLKSVQIIIQPTLDVKTSEKSLIKTIRFCKIIVNCFIQQLKATASCCHGKTFMAYLLC